MHKFTRNLLTEWRKLGLPFSDETIIIAVSGGADSVSLALALNRLKTRRKLNLNFVIAHFNHGLRGIESEKDAEFVKELAEKLNFELEFRNPKSPITNQKGNLEQNARTSRYEFLFGVAEKHNAYAILTAHTQNDQAETLLLNLIRGSGLDGLGGIPNFRFQISDSKFQIRVARPLLSWSKHEDTEAFCNENDISIRHDAMNDDLKFSRVGVRKEIIPLLKKFNPKIIETLANTANLLREDAEELNRSAPELSENLSQNELKELSKSNRLRLLRNWLKHHRGNLRQLDLKHLEAIERLIISPKSGREVELPNREKVIKKHGNLFFEKSRVEKSDSDN